MNDGSVLLLGCGTLGQSVARQLGKDRAFRRVIAADRHPLRAAAATEICGEKAEGVQLDWLDEGSLSRVVADVSLVINTARSTLPETIALVRNILEAGVSYADACADTEILQAMFDSDYIDALAGYRAVGAIPGLGASPGLTNALTAYLGQRLESVDEARFFLLDDLGLRSERQWRERLSDFGSDALVWDDGDWRQLAPMSQSRTAVFPPPVGEVICATTGLAPVTLPSTFGSLTHASSHRGFRDSEVLEAVRVLVSCGLAGQQAVETPVGGISPAEFVAKLFSQPSDVWATGYAAGPRLRPDVPPGPLVRQAQVAGMLRGKKTRFTMTYTFPEERDVDNVAATLATGARMLLTRELPAPGLHAPEALDPAPFLWDMERRGVEIQLAKAIEE